MVEYQVIFNTSYEPDLTFIGTVKQYSDNQFKLKVYLPSGFDTGFQITANIQRDDEAIGSYALAFDTDHFVLSFGAWTTAISGELKVTIQAVADGDIFVFKTITLNVEDTVAVSDYDPDVESPEFISIMEALATKQNADADLTAIASLEGTGHLEKVAPNTWQLNDMSDFATLDETGKVPASQLPSYVDDVIEGIYINSTTFTVNGTPIVLETGKIYVSTNTHLTYRWSGSELIQLSTVAETDPVFVNSPAYNIANQDITNWNEAYSWGNHANAGYLTNSSQTITDLQNTTGTLTNNVGTLTSDLSNLTNTVTTINGSYLTASSTVITNLSNGINSTNSNLTNLTNVVNNKADTSALNSTDSNLANLTNVVANKVDTSLLGQVNGVATLDEAGKVPATQLPSYVDDVLEFANVGAFPPTGEADKIYIAIDTNLTYRWTGTQYVEISPSLALGNTSATAFRGDLGKEAYDWGNHANAGYALNTAIANATNWDTAFGWGNHANFGYLTAEADTLNTVATRGNTTNAISVNFATVKETTFDTTADYGTDKGKLGWNTSDGTLQFGMGNGVVLQIGEETLYQVRNQTGNSIPNGTPVMASGVTAGSGRIAVTPAIADGSIDELRFLGLTTQEIGNGVNGKVTHFGYVRGFDTRGTNEGEDWQEGDILYVSPTNAGKLTNIEPTAPNLKIVVAIVITRNQTSGVVFVRPTAYPHLEHLSDINISNIANGEVLAYNGTANRWENKEVLSLGLNVALSNVANDQYLAYQDGTWVNRDLVVYGTVNSVSINTASAALSVNGTVTNTGNLTVNVNSGYIIPTTTDTNNYNSAFGWGNHQAVGYVVGSTSPTITDGNIAVYNGTTGLLIKDGGVALSGVNTAINHTTLTNNPHSVTKTQVGLGNVDDFAQVRKITSSTTGNIPTWADTTGANLGTGYTVQTTLSNVTTALPTSSAVITYVNGVIGDIETILDGIIG